MGPAPAVAAVRAAVRPFLHRGRLALVACSGGADSLALAAAVAFEAPRAGAGYGLVTVDHGLQPGSQRRARAVAAVGYELGFDPVVVVPVAVGVADGPEGAARAARYAALDAASSAHDADVLLGHTRDDQAETVLMGLARGSGPRSVAGMRAVQGRRIRPLLDLPRSVTEAACAALGLDVWDDPHNRDPRFLRARLRHEVLPLLEDVLSGGAAGALARTSALLRDDLDALDGWAAAVLTAQESGDRLDVAVLAELPRAVRTRVLRLWAAAAGAGALTAEHTHALDSLVISWRGQGPIPLPGAVAVRRVDGRLVAGPGLPVGAPEPSDTLGP